MYAEEPNEFIVFTKKRERISRFFIKYNHHIYYYYYSNKKRTTINIGTVLSKKELDDLLKKYISHFVIFELYKPTADEILDEMLKKEPLSCFEKRLLDYYSITS